MGTKVLNRQNAGWYRFNVGSLECTSIWDGYIHHGYDGFFPNADPNEMARLKKNYGLADDYIPMDVNPVVVKVGDKLVLIDAGMGKTSTMFGDKLGYTTDNLKAAGIDPDDIDMVLITHLHPDHSFGLIHPDGSAVYNNADLYVSAADLAEWTDEANLLRNDFRKAWTEGAIAALAPYRHRLHIVKVGEELMPCIKTKSTAGHSLGQCAYIFEGGSEKVVITGDVAHHQVYDPIHPEWFFHMDFDSDPQMAADAKSEIFAMAVDENIRYHGYHFPFPGIGNLERTDDGNYRFLAEPLIPCL